MSVFSRRGGEWEHLCVYWHLWVFQRSSHRAQMQPACQKKGIFSPGGRTRGSDTGHPRNARGRGTKATKTLPVTHSAGARPSVSRRVSEASPSAITCDIVECLFDVMCQTRSAWTLKGEIWARFPWHWCLAPNHVTDPQSGPLSSVTPYQTLQLEIMWTWWCHRQDTWGGGWWKGG